MKYCARDVTVSIRGGVTNPRCEGATPSAHSKTNTVFAYIIVNLATNWTGHVLDGREAGV